VGEVEPITADLQILFDAGGVFFVDDLVGRRGVGEAVLFGRGGGGGGWKRRKIKIKSKRKKRSKS
jgi:hypothetical protein